MALTLTIISEQRGPLGDRASIVFGPDGGSIGRAHDNDWVLPDPQHYLSAHHARIQCRNGNYYLIDSSTNGVYVNEGTVPIGRRASYPLRHGDRLRIGSYQIAVKISSSASEAPEASSIFPVNPQPFAGSPMAGRADIGADLNVQDLLRPDPSPSSRIGPVDAFGQAVLTDDTALLAYDQSGQRPSSSRILIPSSARRELRAAERAASENAAGIEAFCRGAGIDPRRLPAEASARVLRLVGMMLREALVGLKDLVLAQREMRAQAQIEVGKEESTHGNLMGLSVEDLLLRLLLGHDRNDLDAVQWLRETLGGARQHDIATVRAIHAALGEFIARLEPKSLAQSTPTEAAARNDSDALGLTARFRIMTEMLPGRFPHLFNEAFARAFAAVFLQSRGDHSKS